MANIDLIMQGLGAVPKGIRPNETNRFADSFAQSINENIEFQKQLARQREEMKNKFDMYKTLRQSGYTEEDAYEALKEEKAQAEIDKLKAQTEQVKSEPTKVTPVRERILSKIANGEDLLAGEQKVYDEILKKESGGGSISDILKDTRKDEDLQPEDEEEDDSVAVVNPLGKMVRIWKKDLKSAIRKGYKLSK